MCVIVKSVCQWHVGKLSCLFDIHMHQHVFWQQWFANLSLLCENQGTVKWKDRVGGWHYKYAVHGSKWFRKQQGLFPHDIVLLEWNFKVVLCPLHWTKHAKWLIKAVTCLLYCEESKRVATLPWTGCLCIAGLPPCFLLGSPHCSLAPMIYTPADGDPRGRIGWLATSLFGVI